MEEEWPDYSAQDHRTSRINRLSAENTPEPISMPEFTGKKLLWGTGNLEEHLCLVSDTLIQTPLLTPLQRSQYLYRSLGFQFQDHFKSKVNSPDFMDNLPSFMDMIGDISNLVPSVECRPDKIIPVPWYVELADLKQESTETLSRYLTRIYEILNQCLFSESISEIHKEFVDIILITRLVFGCKEGPANVLFHYLKSISRFPETKPIGLDSIEVAVHCLYEYQDKLEIELHEYKYPKSEQCRKGDECKDPRCLYEHDVPISWMLILANLNQNDEDLLAFAHRVKETLRKCKAENDQTLHEAMEIMSTISLLNGTEEKHRNEIRTKFLQWINSPIFRKSSSSVFEAYFDIVIQYDTDLFKKTQVQPKRKMKQKMKKQRDKANLYMQSQMARDPNRSTTGYPKNKDSIIPAIKTREGGIGMEWKDDYSQEREWGRYSQNDIGRDRPRERDFRERDISRDMNRDRGRGAYSTSSNICKNGSKCWEKKCRLNH